MRVFSFISSTQRQQLGAVLSIVSENHWSVSEPSCRELWAGSQPASKFFFWCLTSMSSIPVCYSNVHARIVPLVDIASSHQAPPGRFFSVVDPPVYMSRSRGWVKMTITIIAMKMKRRCFQICFPLDRFLRTK
jgi:hypothetical protein